MSSRRWPRRDFHNWICKFWQIFKENKIDELEPHLKMAPKCIREPANAMLESGSGNMLEEACKEGRDVEWLRVLLQYGATEIQSAFMLTQSHDRNGDYKRIKAIQFLIGHGADPMEPNRLGQLPFHRAIVKEHLNLMKFWAERYPSMIFHVTSSKSNPLHLALLGSGLHQRPQLKLEMLRFILDLMVKYGLSWINDGACGWKPLTIALEKVQTGNEHERMMIKMLLTAGADVNFDTINFASRHREHKDIFDLIMAISNCVSYYGTSVDSIYYISMMSEERRLELRNEIFFREPLTRRLLLIC